ncbi:MAG: DUF1540 domain-containing protein [Actinomycetales bacterium]|nr:MAG: DUF1540 domain-containing protein [Actinomycetales bacterium]
MTATMTKVSDCTTSDCSFNRDAGCHAFAVTIGKVGCSTFVPLNVSGGLNTVTTQVGACQRADCVHNDHLVCTADAITLGSDKDCLNYAPR